MNTEVEKTRFLNKEEIDSVVEQWGTPVFVYSESELEKQASTALAFSAPFGLKVRYAMKANPNKTLLQIICNKEIGIDASSGFEIWRALRAGVSPSEIALTSQELPADLDELLNTGIVFNACSLHQLEEYGRLKPNSEVGVRINPGIGSGHSQKTNVGGPSSSFGIWHEYTDMIIAIAQKYNLKIVRLHTHIGTGADPAVWVKAANLSLQQVKKFPDITTFDLGGGFKVARMSDEIGTNLEEVSAHIADALRQFADETGRELKLEIEPGTYLTANAGSLITTVQDISDTGPDGHTFLKLDSGMTEILRPSLYGSQHPLVVVNSETEQANYVVVGHCCESGDLLTPAPGEPDTVIERTMHKAAIGDTVVVEGVGAYCATMSALNYNSFPAAAEVLKRKDGTFIEIRRRQTLDEAIALETTIKES